MNIRVVEYAFTRTDLKELIELWKPDGMICSCGFGMSGVNTYAGRIFIPKANKTLDNRPNNDRIYA